MKYNNYIISILTYNNMDINKSIITLDNKRKCGIYRLNNIITGKSYIGSSVNLASRFSNYYSIVFLENRVKKGSSIFYNSLLKYGYSNFSVDIFIINTYIYNRL
jgi:group I intron endonuclease